MSSENEVSVETKTSGRVKWFNNKSGYGFITAMDGDKAGEMYLFTTRHLRQMNNFINI